MNERAMGSPSGSSTAPETPAVVEIRVRCVARRRNGTPCRAHADTAHGSPYCVHHERYHVALEVAGGPLDGWLIYRDAIHFAWEVIIGHDPATGQPALLPPRPREVWKSNVIAGMYRLTYEGPGHAPVWRWEPPC